MFFNRRWLSHLAIGFVSIALSASLGSAAAEESPPSSSLQIIYLDEPPLEITKSEFGKFSRTTVTTTDRDGRDVTYSGVAVHRLLQRSMTPLGESLRGGALRCYVSMEAQDGYRVVFSLPELDPNFSGRVMILADEKEGQPLDAHHGPYRIIIPDEKRQARWIRMVNTIRILESRLPPDRK